MIALFLGPRADDDVLGACGDKRGCAQLVESVADTIAVPRVHRTGLPTHDATNNFRAYSRRVVTEIPIEGEASFALAMELTLKAPVDGKIETLSHAVGDMVEEGTQLVSFTEAD